MINKNICVAVVGLGYVGLPLSVEFGKKYRTIGYDLSEEKITSYRKFCDPTGEVSGNDLKAAVHLTVTTDPSYLGDADVIVVAVPTPVDHVQNPDLLPLLSSSTSIGKHMKPGVIIVYESTVYPGATEEVCIPLLEQYSGLKWKEDFHVGYSPERVNPSDKSRKITQIIKVVSGDDTPTLETVAELYESIIVAGVYRAASIKVAEAAKVIENIQRDLNIALMNELAIIFDRIGIDTTEVLEAAGTKWNFLPFRPGLVGGHCIGVDPYYLTYKATTLGYHPQVILSGRRINDGMGKFIAEKTVKLMIQAGVSLGSARVNVLGLAFKEDCPDLRNSKIPDIIKELTSYGVRVDLYDPMVNSVEAAHEYGLKVNKEAEIYPADAVIVAVAHRQYREASFETVSNWVRSGGVVVDVKACLKLENLQNNRVAYWRL